MNHSDEKNGMPQKSAKPVLLSLLILISGTLIGAGLTYLYMQQHLPKKPEPGPEWFSQRMMRHLVEELRLTPEQQQKIDPIIKQHFEAIDQIRQEARPKISEEIKQMNESIQAILTEPQQKIWEERARRMREFPKEGLGPGRGLGPQRWRGPDGDRRMPDENDGDRFKDRRPPWRQDPNRPERGPQQGPMVPPPLTAPPAEPEWPL